MRVIFSDQAKAELRAIGFFIARDNKARAQSFVRELRQKATDIADYPHAFPLVPRYEQRGIRRRVHRDYLIFYRTDPDAVYIIHIQHGAQDFEAILALEP